MRLAVALGVVAVAFSAAVYVHQRRPMTPGTDYTPGGPYLPTTVLPHRSHPAWEDPIAVLLAIGGIAVAVGIVRFAKPS